MNFGETFAGVLITERITNRACTDLKLFLEVVSGSCSWKSFIEVSQSHWMDSRVPGTESQSLSIFSRLVLLLLQQADFSVTTPLPT